MFSVRGGGYGVGVKCSCELETSFPGDGTTRPRPGLPAPEAGDLQQAPALQGLH